MTHKLLNTVVAISLIVASMGILSQITIVASGDASSYAKDWTFMVYIVGDNNLDPYVNSDLYEMMSVGSTSRVNIIALVDLYRVNGSVMYYISRNELTPIWGNWINEYELNMGDPSTLTWFIREAASKYPARHYALVIWDHGDSWVGVGWDDTNSDYLTMEELKTAIRNSGVFIDIVGFDACLMASIEVAYTLSLTNNVGIIVASEEMIPGYGWPYREILSKLVENPGMTPEEFAGVIVNEYVASYWHGSQGTQTYVTMSAVDARKLPILVSYMASLTNKLLSNIETYSQYVRAAAEAAERFWFGIMYQGPYIDLRDFLENLLKLRRELDPYIYPILSEWSNIIISYNSTRGLHYVGAYGLTIYFPRNKELFYNPEYYYNSVPEFASETNWYKLLEYTLS